MSFEEGNLNNFCSSLTEANSGIKVFHTGHLRHFTEFKTLQKESSPVTGIEMPPTSWQCILNLFMAKFISKFWIFAVLQSFIPSSYVKETPTAKQENDGR